MHDRQLVRIGPFEGPDPDHWRRRWRAARGLAVACPGRRISAVCRTTLSMRRPPVQQESCGTTMPRSGVGQYERRPPTRIGGGTPAPGQREQHSSRALAAAAGDDHRDELAARRSTGRPCRGATPGAEPAAKDLTPGDGGNESRRRRMAVVDVPRPRRRRKDRATAIPAQPAAVGCRLGQRQGAAQNAAQAIPEDELCPIYKKSACQPAGLGRRTGIRVPAGGRRNLDRILEHDRHMRIGSPRIACVGASDCPRGRFSSRAQPLERTWKSAWAQVGVQKPRIASLSSSGDRRLGGHRTIDEDQLAAVTRVWPRDHGCRLRGVGPEHQQLAAWVAVQAFQIGLHTQRQRMIGPYDMLGEPGWRRRSRAGSQWICRMLTKRRNRGAGLVGCQLLAGTLVEV